MEEKSPAPAPEVHIVGKLKAEEVATYYEPDFDAVEVRRPAQGLGEG